MQLQIVPDILKERILEQPEVAPATAQLSAGISSRSAATVTQTGPLL